MLSTALCWSRSTRWRLILRIWRTFNIWVRPPGRSFADTGGGNGDLSDNFNAATPSFWKSDQCASKISSVSELLPTALICLFWARDSFWVARMFWLPCHISKKLGTLAILWDDLSSASVVISMSFCVSVESNNGSAPLEIQLLAPANWPTATFSRMVLPVVFDCLQPVTCRQREQLASTPTPCGMIENMSCATLERSVYLQCVSSCWRHQSVIAVTKIYC